jgi:hypothetical protein
MKTGKKNPQGGLQKAGKREGKTLWGKLWGKMTPKFRDMKGNGENVHTLTGADLDGTHPHR